MSSKITKSLALLVLVLLVVPMFLAVYTAKADSSVLPNGDISLVKMGNPGMSSWTVTTPATTPVKVDIRIDNAELDEETFTSGVWGWFMDVNWDPAKLKLINVLEGSYLNENGGTFMMGTSSALWDNTNGQILGGMMCSFSAYPPAFWPGDSGVLATLWFSPVQNGVTAVTVSGVQLYANSEQGQAKVGSNPDSITNAAITISSPTRTLTVTSGHGSPAPAVGTTTYVQGASVTASVISPVIEGGVEYTCTGWTGTGSVPTSGTKLSTVFTLSADSTITWNWQGGSSQQSTLTVVSAHGSPDPAVGAHTYTSGDSVTASVTSPVTEGGVTYTCTGWTGTGSVPVVGTDTSATFTISVDSTITWNWQSTGGTSVALTVNSAHGSPNPTVGSHDYYANDAVTASVSATPLTVNGITYNTVVEDGVTYACTGWTGVGSVPPSGTGTTVTFTITDASTITWNWMLIPASLEIYTNKGGEGWSVSANAFGPEEQVTLIACLTSEGAVPVGNKLISFYLSSNGVQLLSRTATTNSSGIATATCRLPLTLTTGMSAFGTVTLSSSVTIDQTSLSDSCTFMYNYLLQTTGIHITNNDPHTGSSTLPYFSRYSNTMITTDVTVKNINYNENLPTSFYMTATIYDNKNVPVYYTSVPLTINPPQTGDPNNSNSASWTINLYIPSYAYVGTATLYINIYNTANIGVPYCPEASTQLLIGAST